MRHHMWDALNRIIFLNKNNMLFLNLSKNAAKCHIIESGLMRTDVVTIAVCLIHLQNNTHLYVRYMCMCVYLFMNTLIVTALIV